MKKSRILTIFSLLLVLNSCSLNYLLKQGYYQIDLVAHAKPIEKVLRDKNLALSQRKKLELILDVRKFAAHKLKLLAGTNYTEVNLKWDHTLYTVSASKALQLKPYLWWFPIIGYVPYKGFFEEADAIKEEDYLKAQGFDTLKGKVQGYSTLGYFSDPVWPAMLMLSDDDLIELIIHELAHRTVYINNQASFNESFANFIGRLGTKMYLSHYFGEKSERLRNYEHHLEEEKIYLDFFAHLFHKANNLFESELSSDKKINDKKLLFEKAKTDYLKLPFSDGYKKIDWSRINNAYLLSFKRYNHDEVLFESLFKRLNGDFEQFFLEMKKIGATKDPFASLVTRARP